MPSEKIVLLGKGCYDDIPDELTLTTIPTIAELDLVSAEDFDRTMLENILPKSVEEKVDFYKLLEIDYQWVTRCLRMLNYGPYHETNAIMCDQCGTTSRGQYMVNLNNIACKPLPDGFVNEIKIGRDEWIDFKGDVIIKLPTIRQVLNAYKDKAFQKADGTSDRQLARLCYMITSIAGKTTMTPVEIRLFIEKELSPADYYILKGVVNELTDYGLRAGGTAKCPKCGNEDAAFLALSDDRFFRLSLSALRQWKLDRNKRKENIVPGSQAAPVREHR
jgi:hypothetical protein